jgi:serine beta-lactamase-like protein LACTB
MTSPLAPNRREVLIGATAATLAASAAPALGAGTASAKGKSKPSPRARAAQDIAQGVFAKFKPPALSIAIASPKAVLWSGAYGRANIELDVPARTDHLFRLGSVSKVVTAVLAARLVSRGTIDLDKPIATWLPNLPAQHRATTLRQLLTHRGGVRHYKPADYDLAGVGGPIYTRFYKSNQEILDLFINDPLIAPPGSQVSYSSFGFTLASIVMETAGARPFTEMIRTEVGTALNLPSLLKDDPIAMVPMRASGYISALDGAILYSQLPESARPGLTDGLANIPMSNPAYCWAGAGFLMTTPDCARFGAAMLDAPGSGISAAERALLFTPMTEKTKDSPPLGLAWRVDTDKKGRRRWHHAGATLGGRYGLVVYPESGLSVALASNSMATPGDVLNPASDLVDAFS